MFLTSLAFPGSVDHRAGSSVAAGPQLLDLRDSLRWGRPRQSG